MNGVEKDYPVFSEKFNENRGVFVTLHKNGMLRGCIGYIKPIQKLQQAVINNAVNAAVKDGRFPKVSLKEMDDIDIEISVLTPPQEISGPEEFMPGEHGIIINKVFYSAVFLPQVAPEQGWDREETLSNLCPDGPYANLLCLKSPSVLTTKVVGQVRCGGWGAVVGLACGPTVMYWFLEHVDCCQPT